MTGRRPRRREAPQRRLPSGLLVLGGVFAIAALVVGGLTYLGLGGGAASDETLPDFVRRGPFPVQEAYAYAVEHPEVLQYLPCYCGCVYHGDTNNEDCFIDERLSDGTVVFDPHAST